MEDNDENNYGVPEYDALDFVEEEAEPGQFAGGETEALRRLAVLEKEVGKDLFWLNVFLKETFVVETVHFLTLAFKVNTEFWHLAGLRNPEINFYLGKFSFNSI